MNKWFWLLMGVIGLTVITSSVYYDSSKFQSAPPGFSDDLDAIRVSQRECLNRPEPHYFLLVQAPNGFMVACEKIDPLETRL